jgi:hypothetical protein
VLHCLSQGCPRRLPAPPSHLPLSLRLAHPSFLSFPPRPHLPPALPLWPLLLPQVKAALPALARLIHSQDEEVLTDACWALSYLSDGTNDKIQEVISSGVCRRLVELLL